MDGTEGLFIFPLNFYNLGTRSKGVTIGTGLMLIPKDNDMGGGVLAESLNSMKRGVILTFTHFTW